MKVGVIDYGMGNIFSVVSALDTVGADVVICQEPDSLKEVDRIILPGVGAFKDCIDSITKTGFSEALTKEVIEKGKPVYGICLGMQIMARKSFEFGKHNGLGWIEGDVELVKPKDKILRVPHVGWNDVNYRTDSPLFAGLPESPDFYFVHSFHLQCDQNQDVEATCDYGQTVTAAIKKNNIFASQFHPEKSQDFGLKVLENFLSWIPE
jgi:imidazole glycerol-phosphate synthase subunit HisH